eukprot:5301162-Amphidinium_carterae.1
MTPPERHHKHPLSSDASSHPLDCYCLSLLFCSARLGTLLFRSLLLFFSSAHFFNAAFDGFE